MPDEKHRRIPLHFIIEIICLLIIGSSIFLLVHNANEQKGVLQGSKSTPTHASTSTPTDTPSPTATDIATAQITPTPLFIDDFSNGNPKGWYISNVAGYTRQFMENGLELADTNHKPLIESLPTTHLFDNFVLTAKLTLQQGDNNDSAGLYLRGDSNMDHDYRIDIFGNSTYSISKEYLDTNNIPQSTYIVLPTHISQLKPMGEANTLVVIMQGSTMQLLINDSSVNTISDPDYIKGQVALFVANGMTSPGVTAIFSSIEIDAVPDQSGT